MLLSNLDVTAKYTKTRDDGVTCARFRRTDKCARDSRHESGKPAFPGSSHAKLRTGVILGVLALTAWSSGCALPCLAVHNVRVELRENLDEHMAGIRQWWYGKPVVLHDGSCVGIQDPESGKLVGGTDGGAVEGPVMLPPPSAVPGDKPSQAGER